MAIKQNDAEAVAGASEVKRLLAEDIMPFWKKPNLLRLYLLLIPAALGVEMTTGYDGSVLNGLQAVDKWVQQYDNPRGALLGVISSSLAIGTAIGVLYMPYVNDTYGRRFSVILGSIVVAIGVVIQTCAINGECRWSSSLFVKSLSLTQLACSSLLESSWVSDHPSHSPALHNLLSSLPIRKNAPLSSAASKEPGMPVPFSPRALH